MTIDNTAITDNKSRATEGVASISDEKLIERAVRNSRPQTPGKSPRWHAVSERFGLGSTFATELCKRFSIDPHEQIDGPVCETCEELYEDAPAQPDRATAIKVLEARIEECRWWDANGGFSPRAQQAMADRTARWEAQLEEEKKKA